AGQRLGDMARALPRGDAGPGPLLPRQPRARFAAGADLGRRPLHAGQRRAEGVLLVLISGGDDYQRAEVARVLGALGFDGPAFIKRGTDMAFIDALDPKWKGALPATFMFDGRGAKKKSWLGSVTYDDLRRRVSGLLARRK